MVFFMGSILSIQNLTSTTLSLDFKIVFENKWRYRLFATKYIFLNDFHKKWICEKWIV